MNPQLPSPSQSRRAASPRRYSHDFDSGVDLVNTSIDDDESSPSPKRLRPSDSAGLRSLEVEHLVNSPSRPTGPSKGTKGKAKYIPNRVKRYHERSLDGCLTCRKRRVKCDETKPVCRRCACGDRKCIYADTSRASPSDADTMQQMVSSDAYTASQGPEPYTSRASPSGLKVTALMNPDPHSYLDARDYTTVRRQRSSTIGMDARSLGENVTPSAYGSALTGLPSASRTLPSSPNRLDRPVQASPWRPYHHPAHDQVSSSRPKHDAAGASSSYSYTETQVPRAPQYPLRPPGSPIDVSRVKPVELPPGLGFEDLDPFFPSFEQQALFRHYILEVAPQLCMTHMPLIDNCWIRYHATFAVRSPAGSNGYEDALRSALISMASLDIGHKLSQAPLPEPLPLSSYRLGYPSPNSDEYSANAAARRSRATSATGTRTRSNSSIFGEIAAGTSTIAATASHIAVGTTTNVLLELSNLRREESLRLLRTTLKDRRAPLSRTNAAIMLATVLGLATRDRLAAHQDWQEALSIASKAIAELGGPAVFVDQKDPASLFLIEQIACFDALSSLTSDDYTLFLQPWDDWWYSLMEPTRSFESDSVLQTFGLHRGMIDMLARMTRVEATRRELQARTHTIIVLSEKPGAGSPPTLPPEFEETRLWLESTARALIDEIPHFAKSPLTGEATRTLRSLLPVIMNQLYVAAAELYVHSVIFSKPANDPCFREPTAMLLDRCEEAIRVGITKGLLLPLSFAAFSVNIKDRQRIQIMINDLRPYYKFDLERVEKLNEHLWRLVDSGLSPNDWHMFLKSVGCFNWAF
ncbi:hypothetical protein BCV70DRAFT_214495 [Testicularia cyperi]|uniref:Zn(2)-C6 fungal-type domain-containing protein n=1 Tax=Testicularia cyperi TaxID=1882483 RepID=A0A317XYN9_9BASI|nr:hypothetical protein BCV70DRAFT_214495 [Testicularia cyperi]